MRYIGDKNAIVTTNNGHNFLPSQLTDAELQEKYDQYPEVRYLFAEESKKALDNNNSTEETTPRDVVGHSPVDKTKVK